MHNASWRRAMNPRPLTVGQVFGQLVLCTIDRVCLGNPCRIMHNNSQGVGCLDGGLHET